MRSVSSTKLHCRLLLFQMKKVTLLYFSGILSTSQRSTWRRTTWETGWGWWRQIRKATSCATSRSLKTKSLMLMSDASVRELLCVLRSCINCHRENGSKCFDMYLLIKKILTEIDLSFIIVSYYYRFVLKWLGWINDTIVVKMYVYQF